MAAKNTVNKQKMRSAISELENIYSNMQKQLKTLDETMSSVKKVWTGEAANTYLKSYQKNLKDFQNMAEAINSASNALAESCNVYEMTDAQAMDVAKWVAENYGRLDVLVNEHADTLALRWQVGRLLAEIAA